MHPVLFKWNVPDFLKFVFPDTLTVYSYGTMIALGALLGFGYTAWQSKKQLGVSFEISNELILTILISAIVGGKLFVFFENPVRYFNHPADLLKNFGEGFVFYGSLIFATAGMLIFFKVRHLPALVMLDIMAVTTTLVHGTGRIGCFLAGCCYGIPHEGYFSVVFRDPASQARPLNTPLHPTQLYSAFMIYSILVILVLVNRRKSFNGQLFLLYLMLYSIGRIWIEFYRGDLSRGFVIDQIISNSQFISFFVFCIALYFYIRLGKQKRSLQI